jgi:hypothetical protein
MAWTVRLFWRRSAKREPNGEQSYRAEYWHFRLRGGMGRRCANLAARPPPAEPSREQAPLGTRRFGRVSGLRSRGPRQGRALTVSRCSMPKMSSLRAFPTEPVTPLGARKSGTAPANLLSSCGRPSGRLSPLLRTPPPHSVLAGPPRSSQASPPTNRRCGGLLSLDPALSASCPCGSLHKDIDAGRFGSLFGDGVIEIFRRP